MNIILLGLIIFIFYLFYQQNKRLNKEIFKNHISDSLLIGINKANQHFISQLNYVVNKKPDYEQTERELNDRILKEVQFYSILIYSFKDTISADDWSMIFENPKFDLDVFCNRSHEPLRNMWLTLAILSLFGNEKTKNRALGMLDCIPIEVKGRILRITNHPQYSSSKNWDWESDVY